MNNKLSEPVNVVFSVPNLTKHSQLVHILTQIYSARYSILLSRALHILPSHIYYSDLGWVVLDAVLFVLVKQKCFQHLANIMSSMTTE